MIDLLLDWPPFAAMAVVVGATFLLTILPYAAARAVFGKRDADEQNDLANSVVIRVSALHGLILALVFAQELSNHRDISTAASREAVLVNDVFFDLRRYDVEETAALQRELALYVDEVLRREWSLLASERDLSGQAWVHWEQVYLGVLTLDPQTIHQEALQELMVSHIRDVSSLRRIRENAALSGLQPLFLAAAIFGVMLTSAGFFQHKPTAPNLFLLAIYAVFNGLVIYFIVAFANPYHAPGSVTPIGFERIMLEEIGQMLQSP
ncbi:MAG: DUF4239 domain-containing protein [Paracoccaceae bacterium]|nr:DUF4239 domain-containing protein [Paracoccaceae bacterium]